MTTYNAAIQPKSSNTAGVEPLPSELIVGELALNTEDGKLFTKNSAEEIVTIVGGGGGGAVDSVNGETGVVSLGIQDMDDVDTSTTPPTDGQVLTWVDSNNQWEPRAVPLPDAAATRTLLGIGEYVDDAAAGTGGVASGAMYYNTTTSDYRQKT